MKNILRHLSSFIAPIMMGIVIPVWIIQAEHQRSVYPVITPVTGLFVAGLVLGMAGLLLFLATIRMFILIGNGTIMPWDPTKKLITLSLYGHVRNPMILSLIVIQCSEALIFQSYGIALLALFFFVVNTVYFILSEEPGLEQRFGEEYIEYKRNVPRWIPRLKPWHSNSETKK